MTDFTKKTTQVLTMKVITSIFLVLALMLAVTLGSQTYDWAWGPAMLALSVSVLAAIPALWEQRKTIVSLPTFLLGTLTAGWFTWRAWMSPISEFGQMDLLLIAAVVGVFVSLRAIINDDLSERILTWGIALLLLANILVIGKQLIDPTFSPIFRKRIVIPMISGFYAHYIEAANYLVTSSLLVGAAALFGRHNTLTRIFFALVAAIGIVDVWFTRSRGGILGAAIACGVFAMVALIFGKRKEARWFAPALICFPLIGLAVAAFLFYGWLDAQQVRQAGSSVTELLDNNSRLYFLGIALSCIGLHPWIGGGARSFSWECFRFVDAKAQGDILTHKPEMVHNELMQSATDYGVIGAVLILGLISAIILVAILRMLFEDRPEHLNSRDAWRMGAIAALTGMLVQSCFCFVFHLMPGIILLGICLGQLSFTQSRLPQTKTLPSRILLSISAILSACLLLPAGWKGIQVMRILWPTHFSKNPPNFSEETQLVALTETLAVWPQSSFLLERATLWQKLADTGGEQYLNRALKDYKSAEKIIPFNPTFVINSANLLSRLDQNEEAEEYFAKAIDLQGGMEPGFRAHYLLATHYLHKGLKLFGENEPKSAQTTLELAADQIEKSVSEMHWVISDMHAPRVSIYENLGFIREANGDQNGALISYNIASKLPTGNHINYRAGILTEKIADNLWKSRRPSEALYLFAEARNRINMAGNQLPQGVTLSMRAEHIAYIDNAIAFLKGAKVTPKSPTATQ